ncbi:MAG: M50 family metallopeptidase [Lachnospiraceae bacterium]|nr:M50 family metallopeptidase [Lachnospiraceae bacterium]
MGIIWFFIIFFVIVVVHEFGHFIVARSCGIRVKEFFVGMGPALVSFTRKGTKYSLRLLPLGGACVFEGEEEYYADEEEKKTDAPGKETTAESVNASVMDASINPENEAEDEEYYGCAFREASVWARLATLVAGPFFNFILAFVASLIIIGSLGVDMPILSGVSEGGAAEAAGMQEGDVIVKINNKKIHIFREVSLEAMLNQGETVHVTYERDGSLHAVDITPIYDEKAGRYYYGIIGQSGYTKVDAASVVKYSFYEVEYWIDMTFKSLGMLFTGRAGVKDLSGPVGMADTVSDIYTESKTDGAFYVWINMLNFMILLSANLGVLNLLPVPMLDGGRILLLLVELVRRKPLPVEKEGIINLVGFVLLLILMVVVMYNDIVRVVTGG